MAKNLSYEERWDRAFKASRSLCEAAVVIMAEEAGKGGDTGRVAAHRRECDALDELVHCLRELLRRRAGHKRYVEAVRNAAAEWTGVADVPIEEPGGETAKVDQLVQAVTGEDLGAWSDGDGNGGEVLR